MRKIKEIIVVEGKHDTQNIQKYFDCETIETNGLAINKELIAYIEYLQKKRGVIIFTDPDTPGDKIRNRINESVKGCKNAFVIKQDARTSKKVGIEHANKEVLEEALNNLVTYSDVNPTLTMQDMFELGLSGKKDSQKKRDKISKRFHLGKANTKTLLKRMNYALLTKEEIQEEINESNSDTI